MCTPCLYAHEHPAATSHAVFLGMSTGRTRSVPSKMWPKVAANHPCGQAGMALTTRQSVSSTGYHRRSPYTDAVTGPQCEAGP